MVPAGEDRRIILVGMRSSDGTCEGGFDKKPEINSSNYSNLFILGAAKTDIITGDNPVEIPISAQFTNARKMLTCDFFKPDEDDDTNITPVALNIAHYESHRDIWIETNDIPRTVDIIYQANQVSNVECSNDVGQVSYDNALCRDNFSYVWAPNEQTNLHGIRITYIDGTTDEKTFTPADTLIHGPLTFVSCDSVFRSGDEFDSVMGDDVTVSPILPISLASAITSDGASHSDPNVVCLENAIEVEQPATPNTGIANIGDFVYVVSPQVANNNVRALFSNSYTLADTINIPDDADGVRLIGLKISNASSSKSALAFSVGGNTSDFEMQDVELLATGNGKALNANVFAPDITIKHSAIRAGTGYAIEAASSVILNISDSVIVSSGRTIHTHNGPNLTLLRSKIINNGTSSSHSLLSRGGTGGATFIFIGNDFIDANGAGIVINQATGGSVSLTINDNNFYKTALTGSDDDPYIKITEGISASQKVSIFSVGGNRFCHALPTNKINSTPIESHTGSGSTYSSSLASQINGGVPEVCAP
ncbi:MAG: hypothetical protein HRT44_04585 [Bdellovibrionales bacterium]|nr:hypothetical protein [Bdellovibrionales bacterium]